MILACGASNPRDIQAEGRDAKGIYFAVDYLKAATKNLLEAGSQAESSISAKGKHVPGNRRRRYRETDCVGTAIRQAAPPWPSWR